jgi:hypothetical protein
MRGTKLYTDFVLQTEDFYISINIPYYFFKEDYHV